MHRLCGRLKGTARRSCLPPPEEAGSGKRAGRALPYPANRDPGERTELVPGRIGSVDGKVELSG